MVNDPASRNCDMCGNEYKLNNKELPRIQITKKVDNGDKIFDMVAERDYCKNCFNHFLAEFERKTPLFYKSKGFVIKKK